MQQSTGSFVAVNPSCMYKDIFTKNFDDFISEINTVYGISLNDLSFEELKEFMLKEYNTLIRKYD